MHNTGSHKQLSTQLNQGLQSSSTRRDCFKTPNKRASKPEYFHSQTKRAKKDVKEEKALKRQSTPSAANKTSAKKEDPKREKVKSKSAAKQKTKFEDSCHLEHKDTEVCELCMGRCVLYICIYLRTYLCTSVCVYELIYVCTVHDHITVRYDK